MAAAADATTGIEASLDKKPWRSSKPCSNLPYTVLSIGPAYETSFCPERTRIQSWWRDHTALVLFQSLR